MEKINELKRQNELLREAERLAQIGSYEWDIVTNNFYPSSGLYTIYGLDPHNDDFNINKFNEIHFNDKDKASDKINDALKNLSEFDFYKSIITKNGKEKILQVRGKVIHKSKKAIKVVGTSQDITNL